MTQDIFDQLQTGFYQTYTPAIGAATYIGQGGRWVCLFFCNFPAQVQFDNGPAVPLRAGMIWVSKFNNLKVICPATSKVAVPKFTVLIGDGYPPDFTGRADQVDYPLAFADEVVGPGSLYGPVNPGLGAIGMHVGTPANSPNAVRLGDATIGAAKGVLLQPGEAKHIAGNGDLYIFNPGAANVTVTFLAEMAASP